MQSLTQFILSIGYITLSLHLTVAAKVTQICTAITNHVKFSLAIKFKKSTALQYRVRISVMILTCRSFRLLNSLCLTPREVPSTFSKLTRLDINSVIVIKCSCICFFMLSWHSCIFFASTIPLCGSFSQPTYTQLHQHYVIQLLYQLPYCMFYHCVFTQQKLE